MTFLLEDPTPIIVVGIIAEAVLGVFLLRTGRGSLLWAMGGVLGLVLVGLLVERLVVTERERIEATLLGAAAALEANDMARLEQYLSPTATETRGRAAWILKRVQFSSVKVKGVELKSINRLTSPPTAKTVVDVLFTAEDRNGSLGTQTHPIRLGVDLRLEGDNWRISGHTEDRRYER